LINHKSKVKRKKAKGKRKKEKGKRKKLAARRFMGRRPVNLKS